MDAVVHCYPSLTGLPGPAVARTHLPRTGVIWHPTPGVRRYPAVAKIRELDPRAIAKRIPAYTDEVGPPYQTAHTRIDKIAEVVQIAEAKNIRRRAILHVLGVA